MDKIKVSKVDEVLLQRGSECEKGSLHLTQHHLIFRNTETQEEQWIPYALLSLVTRQASLLPLVNPQRRTPSPQSSAVSSISLASSSSSKSGRIYPLQLRFRTFDAASLGFDSESKATDVFESLRSVAVIPSPEQVYAFYYAPQPPFNFKEGWSIYDFKEEFTRQGVGRKSKAWRFSDINAKYELSSTYPALFAVPSRISDATLQYAAKYRSKGRIPTLTYLHWANGGSITRCAQPLPGLKQARSAQDEKVVEAIFSSHTFAETQHGSPLSSIGTVYGATTTNLIVDARPTTNAVATYARGGGTENMDHYKGCRKAYMGIENIHVMRDSINRVVEALRAADEPTTFGLDVGVEADIYDTNEVFETDFGNSKPRRLPPARQPLDIAALKRSNWLRHLSTLLEGAAVITRNVHIASSHAMIHCSDGWDRTSQLAALAEICLDPYYRTMKGFAVLVEKDWLSFGHRFADRCGHGGSEKYFVTAAGHAESSEEDEGEEPEGVVNASQPGGGGAQAAANAFWGFTKQLTSNFGGGGSGQGHGNIKETSPVFTQFLDCVWQIKRQFPERFEFNDEWLSTVHRELYECRFGTFLANCERERKVPTEIAGKSIVERTHSVWEYMLSDNSRQRFLNSRYDTSLDDPKRPDADMGVLLIKSSDVRWWTGVFGKRIEEANKALDFEESERIRRKAEKARWEEERQRERERKEAEEQRLLEEQRKELQRQAQAQWSRENGGSSGSTLSNHSAKGAVDLMTASQLQTGHGVIDTSKLAYKPRASPAPSNRSAGNVSTGGTANPSPPTISAQQQPTIDAAAARFKSWAIGGWDRFQEAMAAGSADEAAASSSSSSSSSAQHQLQYQPAYLGRREPSLSSNPWTDSSPLAPIPTASSAGSSAAYRQQQQQSREDARIGGSKTFTRDDLTYSPVQEQQQQQSSHTHPISNHTTSNTNNNNPWRDDTGSSSTNARPLSNGLSNDPLEERFASFPSHFGSTDRREISRMGLKQDEDGSGKNVDEDEEEEEEEGDLQKSQSQGQTGKNDRVSSDLNLNLNLQLGVGTHSLDSNSKKKKKEPHHPFVHSELEQEQEQEEVQSQGEGGTSEGEKEREEEERRRLRDVSTQKEKEKVREVDPLGVGLY